MTTRYQLEGRDEDGQWNWSHVSADGIEANTILDTALEAEAARRELVRIYGCPDDEIRVVAVEDTRATE
jgi:hypothetical protein